MSRKPPPADIATQAVLDKVANDPSQGCGVELGQLEPFLVMKECCFRGTYPIKILLQLCTKFTFSDFIRNVLATHAPEGLARRFPGANRIRRSNLSALGPNQHHADGHEKLNGQALKMGGVGLPIYGVKDQWCSFVLHLVVVPNNQLGTTIGHVHLDCMYKYKCMKSSSCRLQISLLMWPVHFTVIPITFVTDKGSETGILYASQTALR